MKNKKVVFGTGPLGLWVMHLLAEKGHVVDLVNRSGRLDYELPENVSLVSCDATREDEVYEICKGADTVFFCAMPPYTEWPEKFPPLMEGLVGGLSRLDVKLVYGDNLYMYGPTGGEEITEELPYAATGRKGVIRARMSEMLEKAHKRGDLNVVIGRASDFYGPLVVNAGLGEMFFNAAMAGKTANLVGRTDRLHTFTFIKDFARDLILLSENDEAFGQVWHTSNDTTVTTGEFIEAVGRELGKPVKYRTAGKHMLAVLGLFDPMIREVKEMLYSYGETYVVSDKKFRDAFGVVATPKEAGIRETVEWYRSR